MSNPQKSPWGFPTGRWVGTCWIEDDANTVVAADAVDAAAIAAAMLNDPTKLESVLQERMEYRGTWGDNNKVLPSDLQVPDMSNGIDFSKLTAAQIAATRKLALEYTYTSPCPDWVAAHLQQCDTPSLYCAVAQVLQGEKMGTPIDWEQVWDDAETLKARGPFELEWNARTGALLPIPEANRTQPVGRTLADLLNNGRHGRLPDIRPRQTKPSFVKTADGGFAATPVKLRQPVAKSVPMFAYVWDSLDSWTSRDQATSKPTTKLIEDLTDQELWNTLVWLIANVDELHELHCRTDTADANRLPAAFWLTSRISFNSLVLSAISREFTFMPTEAAFLRAYMQNMPDKSAFVEAKPWQRPFAENAKLQDLGSNLEKRIDQTRNQQHTGRPARAIRKV